MPSAADELLTWTRSMDMTGGAVTSYMEVERANDIIVHAGTGGYRELEYMH